MFEFPQGLSKQRGLKTLGIIEKMLSGRSAAPHLLPDMQIEYAIKHNTRHWRRTIKVWDCFFAANNT